MSAANPTTFWVICCEENTVTREIARTVDSWQMEGVRSLIGDCRALLSHVDSVADAGYVIFVAPDEKPCSQAKVYPLNIPQIANNLANNLANNSAKALGEQSPVDRMADALNKYGRAPQAWLLQLPKTEVRARYTQPVSSQKSVAQAIAAIEVFVRNYTRSLPFSIPVQTQTVLTKPKKKVVLSHYRRV